jgi:hypothetical protein
MSGLIPLSIGEALDVILLRMPRALMSSNSGLISTETHTRQGFVNH